MSQSQQGFTLRSTFVWDKLISSRSNQLSFVKKKKSTLLIALTRFWNNSERYIESSVPKLWIWMEYQSCEGACHNNVCPIPRATYHTKYLAPLICNLQVVVASVREKKSVGPEMAYLERMFFFCQICRLSSARMPLIMVYSQTLHGEGIILHILIWTCNSRHSSV